MPYKVAERKIVDMWRCDTAGSRARTIWQILFDYYRREGGSLENMDNLLSDLESIQRHLETPSTCRTVLYWVFNGSWTGTQIVVPPRERKRYAEIHNRTFGIEVEFYVYVEDFPKPEYSPS